MNRIFESSELIVNPDGSIFHLHIKPGELGDYILLVGDPKRVDLIATFFETKLFMASNREFYSITGIIKNTRITALSTGIGTDNVDIVINELDALVNIDFNTRQVHDKLRRLKLIRIGTSGSLQTDIEPGSFVVSKYVIGFDGLLNFYKGRYKECISSLEEEFVKHSNWSDILPAPYSVNADPQLLQLVGVSNIQGITISANGFYGPQGRELRAENAFPDLFRKLHEFRYGEDRITNFEMECSALYGMSKILGHQALTICAIIANRATKAYLGDYTQVMTDLVSSVLDAITKNE